jgi:hypothetical protein
MAGREVCLGSEKWLDLNDYLIITLRNEAC